MSGTTGSRSKPQPEVPRLIHPERWRETCDPFALPYTDFRLLEVLGYPHAGNDVFQVRGLFRGQETFAYIKAARQQTATVGREAELLPQLAGLPVPQVLDFDRAQGRFLVTRELPGRRLSVIVGENEGLASLDYMEEYGEALGRLHGQKPVAGPQTDRNFYHPPTAEQLEKLGLRHLQPFFAYPPAAGKTVFCHGDFHYANVLWQEHRLSGILDLELAGYGDRDFDIAWALFVRPGQRFLKTEDERRCFLRGYRKHGDCDDAAIRYYTAQCYVHFLSFCDEADWRAHVRAWLEENCRAE